MAEQQNRTIWDFLDPQSLGLGPLYAANHPQVPLRDPEVPLPQRHPNSQTITATANEVVKQSQPQRAPASQQAYTPMPSADSDEPSLSEMYRRLIQERMGGIKGMQTQMDEIQVGEPRPDLGQLVAWGDNLAGTNTAQFYKSPNIERDKKQQTLEKLRDAVSKEQGRIGSDYVQLMAQQQRAEDRARDDEWRRMNFDLKKSQGGSSRLHEQLLLRGMQLNPDGTLSKVEGGLPWQQEQEKQEKARRAQQTAATQGSTVVEDAGRALEVILANPGSFGPRGGLLGKTPGFDTETKVALGHIKSMEGNVSFDQLNQMRQNSPTGGALGNVSNAQQEMLASVLGKLDVEQRPDVLAENLKRVQNIYNDIVHGRGMGPKRHVLEFDDQGRKMTPEARAKEEARMDALFADQQGQSPSGAQIMMNQQGGMVTVTNGQETLQIPQADARAAQAEGYRVVR